MKRFNGWTLVMVLTMFFALVLAGSVSARDIKDTPKGETIFGLEWGMTPGQVESLGVQFRKPVQKYNRASAFVDMLPFSIIAENSTIPEHWQMYEVSFCKHNGLYSVQARVSGSTYEEDVQALEEFRTDLQIRLKESFGEPTVIKRESEADIYEYRVPHTNDIVQVTTTKILILEILTITHTNVELYNKMAAIYKKTEALWK